MTDVEGDRDGVSDNERGDILTDGINDGDDEGDDDEGDEGDADNGIARVGD